MLTVTFQQQQNACHNARSLGPFQDKEGVQAGEKFIPRQLMFDNWASPSYKYIYIYIFIYIVIYIYAASRPVGRTVSRSRGLRKRRTGRGAWMNGGEDT